MRGIALAGRRRALTVWVLLGVLATAFALAGASAGPAYADTTDVPSTMSTATEATSSFAVHVPTGVEPRAINGAVTQAAVVEGGTITFRVNGAVRKTVPSSLYQKVRIPVDPSDVIADGTIGLSMSTEGPVPAGSACVPTGGVASMRNIELDYRGTETPPTTVADFFPPASAGVTVVIPEDADAQMITAGLTAVAALAYRYDDDTPIDLSLTVPPPATSTAGQRVVALVDGPAGDVATAVSTSSGIPMLTLTGSGDALVNAARALSTDLLGLSGTDAQNLSQEAKPRSTARTRTLEDLGTDALSLTGYGSVTQRLELRQDSFGVPVSGMDLHLQGSHTAFAEASGARLDVRANGDLVGSTVLGPEADFALDLAIPSAKLRSVNDVDLTLTAVAPDGSACTPPSIPPAEVDLDTSASTVTVDHGTGETKGFQLFPQIFEGTLPVALRSSEGRQSGAAINAAALVAALQRAAGSPLEIQLVPPERFLADQRSGLIVGALSGDSEALDAPLKLSSTRLVDRDDATVAITSQDPYAVLESIDRNNRLVLMLGSWAPGGKAAPGELARKVVDAVSNNGWAELDGDLVLADAQNPPFVAASRTLAPHQTVKKDRSYTALFVIVIAVLLVVLAVQVISTIRRDRRLARARDEDSDDEPLPDEVVDDEPVEVDELGDVDDLGVHDYAAVEVTTPVVVEDDDTGELEAIGDHEEYVDDEDDWGDEAEEITPDEPDPESEPEPEPEPEPTARKTPAKKIPTKKTAGKTPAKKAPAKKAPPKKSPPTESD